MQMSKNRRNVGTMVMRSGLTLLAGFIAVACVDEEAIDLEDEMDIETTNDKVIYGADDRVEMYQVNNASDLADADGTASLFFSSSVSNQGDGTSILGTAPFRTWWKDAQTAYPVCADQPFYNQQQGAYCSGFLVGPQILATAGHCTDGINPSDIRVVFGFRMYDSASVRTRVYNNQIYSGASIRSTGWPASDWSLITLDRPVTDHHIYLVRSSGNVPVNTNVNILGHPNGLPAKFSGPAPVRSVNAGGGTFATTTDGNRGNSGSPVVNDSNHQVEGILISGPADGYVYNTGRGCAEELRCSDTGGGTNCSQINNTLASQFRARVPNPANGSSNGWRACRGSGWWVCSDMFNTSYYDLYFQNHPNCQLNTTCAGTHGLCSAACPAPTLADSSVGTSQSWRACRGSGVYVCQEKVSAYPHYFDNHPRCRPNSTCGGSYSNCSLSCPPPTEADR